MGSEQSPNTHMHTEGFTLVFFNAHTNYWEKRLGTPGLEDGIELLCWCHFTVVVKLYISNGIIYL